MEFDLIVKYPNSINQISCFCEHILTFCNNVILLHKDRMLFHLSCQYDGNEQTKVTIQPKTKFGQEVGKFFL